MQSYDTSARFYDPVQGDRANHAAYVRWLIEKHHPTARTAIELACGTGSILVQLQPDFEVTGVDLSGPMLAVAAEKVPEARLVQADMTEVHIGEAFDVVLCLYDSVNHLLDFSQWEALFDRAREHLSDRGIFVFDINTDYQLAELVSQPQQAVWFGDRDLLLIDVVAGEDTVWSTGTSRYSSIRPARSTVSTRSASPRPRLASSGSKAALATGSAASECTTGSARDRPANPRGCISSARRSPSQSACPDC